MEEAKTKIQPLITWVDAVRTHKFDMPASSDSDSAEAITDLQEADCFSFCTRQAKTSYRRNNGLGL